MADHDAPNAEDLTEHTRFVRAVALSALGGDDALVDDVVQDTWVAALETRSRPRSVRAWLAGVTRRRAARSVLREAAIRRRERRAARPERAPDADAAKARVEAGVRVARAVLTLDEHYRTPIVMRFGDGLPPREIAEQLGVPVETVRTRIRRGLERLRAEVAPDARLVVLPLLAAPGPLLSAASTAVIGGGAVMGKKIAVASAAVVLLGPGAMWVAGGFRGDDPPAAAPPAVLVAHPPSEAPPPAVERPVAERDDPELDPATKPIAPAAPGDPEPRLEPPRKPASPAPGPAPAPAPAPVMADIDPDRDIHGVVVRADGSPVAGAELTTVEYPWRQTAFFSRHGWSDETRPGPSSTSRSDGSFALRTEAGQRLDVHVRAEGLAPVVFPHVSGGSRVRIVLDAPVELAVRVRDMQGQAAAGAVVSIWASPRVRDAGLSFRRIDQRVVADAAGRAELSDVPAGATVRLLAWTPDRASRSEATRVTLPTTGRLEKELVLLPASGLEGRVLDARTRAPVVGARVGAGVFLGLEGRDYVLTDGEGRYRMPGGLPPGFRDVCVFGDGYALARKRSRGGVLDFALDHGVEVRGRVVDAGGRAVEGARLSAYAWDDSIRTRRDIASLDSAITDPKGRFVLSGLAADRSHELRIESLVAGRLNTRIPARAAAAAPLDLGDLRLGAPNTLEIHIHDAANAPLRHVEATLYALDAKGPAQSFNRIANAKTGDSGRLSFTGLAPATYVLRLATSPRAGVGGLVQRYWQVTAPPEGGDTQITIDTGTRPLRLRVVDEGGAPLPDVSFHVRDWPQAEWGARTMGGGMTDGEGLVTLHVNVGAEVHLGLASRGYVRVPIVIQPDVDAHTVVLTRSLALTGRLLDREGEPIVHGRIRITGEGRKEAVTYTDRNGVFRQKLAKGERVDVRFAGEVHDHATNGTTLIPLEAERVDVLPDAQDLALRVRPVSRREVLEVRVLAPDGTPLQGVDVGIGGLNATAPTDRAGLARLEQLFALPSDVRVSFTATPDRPWLVPPLRVVPDGQRIEIQLVEGHGVEGRVLLPDGSPANDAVLTQRLTPPTPPRRIALGRDARFFVVLPKQHIALLLKASGTDAEGKKLETRDWQVFEATGGTATVTLDAR